MDAAKDIGAAIMTILTGIVLIAILGVIVSGQSQTSSVIQSFGQAFAQIMTAIVSPISGSSSSSSSNGASTTTQGLFDQFNPTGGGFFQ